MGEKEGCPQRVILTFLNSEFCIFPMNLVALAQEFRNQRLCLLSFLLLKEIIGQVGQTNTYFGDIMSLETVRVGQQVLI